MSLVRVEICTTAVEAHILKGRLLADGIPAFVEFDHLLYIRWDYSNLFGGVRVSVPSVCVEDALAVLRRLRTTTMYEMALEAEIGVDPSDQCRACGSKEIKDERVLANLALFVAFSTNIPVPFSHHSKSCRSCAAHWSTNELRSPSLFTRAAIILILALAFASVIELGHLWLGAMST